MWYVGVSVVRCVMSVYVSVLLFVMSVWCGSMLVGMCVLSNVCRWFGMIFSMLILWWCILLVNRFGLNV